KNVSFAYPSAPGRPVLDRVDLVIPAGRRVGIIGTTGSGKTTLVDLLIGLLKPDAGQVLVNGVPMGDLDAAGWRHALAYVPQFVFLVDEPARRSIAFGLPDAEIDD